MLILPELKIHTRGNTLDFTCVMHTIKYGYMLRSLDRIHGCILQGYCKGTRVLELELSGGLHSDTFSGTSNDYKADKYVVQLVGTNLVFEFKQEAT